MFQAMNQDIYDAVMDAKAAQERVVDGGNTQSDDADDCQVNAYPRGGTPSHADSRRIHQWHHEQC